MAEKIERTYRYMSISMSRRKGSIYRKRRADPSDYIPILVKRESRPTSRGNEKTKLRGDLLLLQKIEKGGEDQFRSNYTSGTDRSVEAQKAEIPQTEKRNNNAKGEWDCSWIEKKKTS